MDRSFSRSRLLLLIDEDEERINVMEGCSVIHFAKLCNNCKCAVCDGSGWLWLLILSCFCRCVEVGRVAT